MRSDKELMNIALPNIKEIYQNHKRLIKGVILALQNIIVNFINIELLKILHGESQSYESFETVLDF